MIEIFTSPAMSFKPADSTITIAGLVGDVDLFHDGEYIRTTYTIPPSCFFSFAWQVLKIRDFTGWRFYVDCVERRYYFGIQQEDTGEYWVLWYYTQSNLPYWYYKSKKKS